MNIIILLQAMTGTGLLVILSVVVFLLIILVLVVLLLFAKKKLTPQGLVHLDINNGQRVIETEPGSTILSTLSNNGVFLPSACGGGGTCGMCKCQVIEGGGSILPTETGFFSRKEQQNYWRLGCQVKVRNDMKIKVPESVLGIKKWECEVVSNRNVATFIKEFVVKLPEGESLVFDSGGYIQIDVPRMVVDFKEMQVEKEFRDEWDNFKMWDLRMNNPEPTYRAYSMANHPAEGNIVMLNIRIATPPWDRTRGTFARVNPGICSSFIFSRKPGDKVMISGPYGEFHIKPTNREMVYIGGGAGMAPLRSHIFHLFHTEKTTRKVSYWYGARSKREVFYEDEFRAIERDFPNFTFNLALSEPKPEDNWTGLKGFIHKVLYDEYLSKIEEPEEIEFYLCGPPQMTDAVLKMLYDLGVPDDMVAFDDFGG
ncbi:MAG: NADH:ubiquinone reductase (Na(+)-transporting) subunit F [Bacteroidales bacterium]|nr:NADH:ubiquinone reductase (Na(+)-transporting) subunit F [Bacteroidales bacterium]MDD2569960.1 NADH:ubiquinone reductase (Na(+)-transporting) subunit F [Bacteroidales bacterium]MDD2812743.1 NADH:ubiquinone reductase (Na(+)-transporting) subunit F [Bacteroidales bacterium]MDD3385896.1 NADH:ubiquinone reductase (Na(+)-transporting) subunit F [Bacteroidales bacterium]MDD3810690.1 NADH:ubiquinone reductase (Na(+)-transporting) subunit F [Bacteroidales bacterium]